MEFLRPAASPLSLLGNGANGASQTWQNAQNAELGYEAACGLSRALLLTMFTDGLPRSLQPLAHSLRVAKTLDGSHATHILGQTDQVRTAGFRNLLLKRIVAVGTSDFAPRKSPLVAVTRECHSI